MTENPDQDAAEEPMVPTETPYPDHGARAKSPHRVDDDELERRVEHEREQTGADGPAGI